MPGGCRLAVWQAGSCHAWLALRGLQSLPSPTPHLMLPLCRPPALHHSAKTSSKCACGECSDAGCKAACKGPVAKPPTKPPACSMCSKARKPMCGKNGKVYLNACLARVGVMAGWLPHPAQQQHVASSSSSDGSWAGSRLGVEQALGCPLSPGRLAHCTPSTGPDLPAPFPPALVQCAGTTNKFLCGKRPDATCKKQCAAPGGGCYCPALFAPVCGKDGGLSCRQPALSAASCLTLRSPCSMKGRYLLPASANQPLCLPAGKVYPNACSAGCAKTGARFPCGGLKSCASDCKRAAKAPTCKCASAGKKVCGYDGKVYPNAACLKCNVIPKRFSCAQRKNCEAACKRAAAAL